ncbi:MAG: hypothetical protein NW216_09985 [Hyphomicrobium sp.]|nr:hypothetical protein [Hyphomicrobium sp.]
MRQSVHYLAAFAILVAGICTTAMNWRFSYQLGANEFDSVVWATFSVALDVAKWLMLPFAALACRHHKFRAAAAFAIWLVASIYSFAAAIGFAAFARETAVAEHAVQSDLRATLELMRQSPRWTSSAACADVTAERSRTFCANYAEVEAKLTATAHHADPQSALFARITGHSPDTMRIVLSVFLAVACEIISALGFYAILSLTLTPAPVRPVPKPKPTPTKWKPPKWSPQVAKNSTGAPLPRWQGRT